MKALREAIQGKTFAPAYYFFGEDDYLKDEGLRRLAAVAVDSATRDFNYDVRKGADLDAGTLSSLLGVPPMMAERRMVVIKDVDGMKKDARRALDAYLKNPAGDTLLVMTSGAEAKADKGLSASTEAIEFDGLSGAQVPKWIVQRANELGATIAPAASELLQDAVGNDLSMLATEVAKLVAYSSGREIDEAAVSAVVGIRRDETMGTLLDAVLEKDAARAAALVTPVLQQPKSSGVQILMALTTQTLAMAIIAARGVPMPRRANEFFTLLKSGGSNYTGRAWGEAVSAWTKASPRWSVDELRHALDVLLQADAAIKQSRVSSEEQVLATAILSMCGGVPNRHAA